MYYTDYLEHHGIKGTKWGVRRYQNEDGTLTSAGKQKLKDYKFKESNKVRKAATRFKNAEDRYQARKKKQGVLVSEKHNARSKKIMDRYNKELKAISKMKYRDMQKEKVAVGKSYLKALGATYASVTVATVAGLPVYPIFWTNTAKVKQNLRIGPEKKSKK